MDAESVELPLRRASLIMTGAQNGFAIALHCTIIRRISIRRATSRGVRSYYRQQREKGSSYQVAVRALAFKWIRILYRCWQTRTPYNETTYLNALRKRGSPLLKNLMPDPTNT